MTGEQEDLYDELSEIAPTVGYQINTDENWDYHETSLRWQKSLINVMR